MEDGCKMLSGVYLKRLKMLNCGNCSAEEITECLKNLAILWKQNFESVEWDPDLILNCLQNMLEMEIPKLSCQNATKVFVELFRFLRNFVARTTVNQAAAVRNEGLFKTLLNRIYQITMQLQQHLEGQVFEELLELKCAIQFLGNLVVSNTYNKNAVWSSVVSMFKIWLECSDITLRNCSVMLLYNCVLEMTDHREYLLQSLPEKRQLTSLILKCCIDECEWGLFVIQRFLESRVFLKNQYCDLLLDARIVILDILSETLATKTEIKISAETFDFIAKMFEEKADIIFKAESTSEENLEPVEVTKLLDILCTATSNSDYQSSLQKRSTLLCAVFCLLKSVHMAGKELPKVTETNHSVLPTEELSNHPTFALKRDLIRLISNLCYNNRHNQDMMRTHDGIPLLLDCCKLDARNPYIIQWVIFAIRNLCKDNLENQQIIAKMDQKDLKPCVMDDFGFMVQESSGTIPIGPTNCEKSKAEMNKDDIRDLFL